jgi:hypothetical protein
MQGLPFRVRLCFFVGAGLVITGCSELFRSGVGSFTLPAIAIGILLSVLGFVLAHRLKEPPQ